MAFKFKRSKKKKQEYRFNEHDINQVEEIYKSTIKKKRMKRIKIIIALLAIMAVAFFFVSDLSKVKKVTVKGCTDTSVEAIEEASGITSKDYYFLLNRGKIKKKLLDVPLVGKANISVDLLGNVTIKITEAEKILFGEMGVKTYIIDELGKVSVAKNEKVIQSLTGLPKFSNFDKEKTLKKFAKEYIKIPDEIKAELSDIIFEPKEQDKYRMRFIMNNGKALYLRIDEMAEQLSKFDYDAYMSTYSDRCVFSFEGNNLYMQKCEKTESDEE